MLRLEYMPLSVLKKWPKNPKQHDLPSIGKSMDRFGYTAPILIDEKSGLMVAGHGRVEELLEKQRNGEAPPERIRVKAGEWLVPVIRGIEFKNKKEAEAYLLADNQLTILGGFDDKVLAEMLKDHTVNLEGLGWNLQDVATLIQSVEPPKEETEPIPELLPEPTTKTGDIWQLDKHRIMCGDSTKPEDVMRLFGRGGHADSIVTDPPYGVNYTEKNKKLHALGKELSVSTPIVNDDLKDYSDLYFSFLANAPLTVPNTVYIFMCGKNLHVLRYAAEKAGIHWAQYLIWIKNNHVLGYCDYHYRHEHIFYGWREKHKFYGSGDTVLEYDMPHTSPLHPTMKPIPLLERLISDGSPVASIVYDPFLGSGSTLIAAENLGRTCYAMEIDPHYTDVAVKRWENHTGKKAERIEQ